MRLLSRSEETPTPETLRGNNSGFLLSGDQPVLSVEVALEADRWAREKADSLVHALAR